LYAEPRGVYETAMNAQVDQAIELKGEGDLDALLAGGNTWEINGSN
jgi:2-oxoglutarate ferredoxin oxidoreductase subunit beta